MIVLDTSILVAHFNPRTSDARQVRLKGLFLGLEKSRQRALIPTPVLTEFLAKADNAGQKYRDLLAVSKSVQIVPFGERAAVECALMLGKMKTKADRKNEAATWAKAKFDWQIAAIAKVEQAKAIYTFDEDIVRLGKTLGIEVLSVDSLPVPAELKQHAIAFPKASAKPEGSSGKKGAK